MPEVSTRHAAATATLLAALFALAPTPAAADTEARTRKAAARFEARFAKLSAKLATYPFLIQMAPGDDPAQVAPAPGRPARAKPAPIPSPEDLAAAARRHVIAVRRCYAKQLAADPSWQGRAIVDVSVHVTGRVGELGVQPAAVRRDVVGQCLMSEVPKWSFPRFTGDVEEGVRQEVVNASFPYQFVRRLPPAAPPP